MKKLESIVSHIAESLGSTPNIDSQFAPVAFKDKVRVIEEHSQNLSEEQRLRLIQEFSDTGPLQPLLVDNDITEIIVNGPQSIWYEKSGKFYEHTDHFLSTVTYSNYIHLLSEQAGLQTNHRSPFANGEWRHFRIHMTAPPVTPDHCITLRRIRPTSLSLEELQATGWCDAPTKIKLGNLVVEKKNILVVGSTGSGKTTLLNSLLTEAHTDRCVFIEDTPELLQFNSLSTRLLTRFDANGSLPDIGQTELVKQSLRMRPDRIILGEIRGSEAKDLLLALSTGHHGSMASIHASTAAEALIRLEMLVLMGAPEWNLLTIRRLIQLTINAIVVTEKTNGLWSLKGIYKIASQESFGFVTEEMDS